MLKQYKEKYVLYNIHAKEKYRHPCFKPPFNDWKLLYDSFRIVEYRAKTLLKLIYPKGIIDYIKRPEMIQFTFYEPNINLYIDYFESIAHTAPYNKARQFNPLNQDDIKFVSEVNNFSTRQRKKFWVSVDRVNTWAGSDYRKYIFTKMNNLNYKIFWTISEIENYTSSSIVNASWEVINSYYTSLTFYNILYEKINELYNQKYFTEGVNYLSNINI